MTGKLLQLQNNDFPIRIEDSIGRIFKKLKNKLFYIHKEVLHLF